MKIVRSAVFFAFVVSSAHCGSASETPSPLPLPVAQPTEPSEQAAGDAAAPTKTTDASAPSKSDSGAPAASDPAKSGPYAIAKIDAKTHVSATGDDVPIHCAYPVSGPSAGPFPVVVLAHGFQLAASQYYGYVERLASHGYVALTADYPAGFTSKSNLADAADLSGGLDWAIAAPQLAGRADATKAGVMGHSRGGKDAVLAVAKDARFKAVLGLDPVDSKPPLGCDETTECPDGSDAIGKVAVPSLFLGETTDASGGFLGQACAPAADNFATFYASAKSPSVKVNVIGANHMSFLDDPDSCGLTCGVCQTAKAPHATVLDVSYAMTVAFFERHLRGDTAYDTYLMGAQAQARYVTQGVATIDSK